MRNASAVVRPLIRSVLALSTIIGLLSTAPIRGGGLEARRAEDSARHRSSRRRHRYLPDHTLENYALGSSWGPISSSRTS